MDQLQNHRRGPDRIKVKSPTDFVPDSPSWSVIDAHGDGDGYSDRGVGRSRDRDREDREGDVDSRLSIRDLPSDTNAIPVTLPKGFYF